MPLGSGRCHYHPDRPGLGVCVECRNVICVECTTQFEGINRCATCLGERLKKAQRGTVRSEWGAGNVLLALLALASLYGVFLGVARLLGS